VLRLQDLSKDKITIIERILSSQGICKALKYDKPNFLDQPDIIDPSDLIMNKIFPFYRVPDSEKDVSTYILLSFRNYQLVKSAYKSGIISISAITHKDLAITDYGFLRYDYIISEIDKLVNGKLGLGIGRLKFEKMDEVLFVNTDYIGSYIAYKLWEFN
jgi:hypothetical protein